MPHTKAQYCSFSTRALEGCHPKVTQKMTHGSNEQVAGHLEAGAPTPRRVETQPTYSARGSLLTRCRSGCRSTGRMRSLMPG
jgi:hypothetical protein